MKLSIIILEIVFEFQYTYECFDSNCMKYQKYDRAIMSIKTFKILEFKDTVTIDKK